MSEPTFTTKPKQQQHLDDSLFDGGEELIPGSIARIVAATEARGDFAGAALLREAMHRVRTTVR